MNSPDANSSSNTHSDKPATPASAREAWSIPILIPLDLSAARGFFCSRTSDSGKDLGPMNCGT